MKLAQYHIKTGEYLREVDALKNIKTNEYMVPPYHTPDLPSSALQENECHAFLDSNGNVPRDYKGGSWVIKERFVKVTAYNKQDKSSKEFDDKTLVTDDYTLEKPLPDSIWQDDAWVVQLDLAQQSKRININRWRTQQENLSSLVVDALNTQWNADPAARGRIEQTLASTFVPPFWTDALDNDVDIVRDDLVTIYNKIVEQGFAIHERQREMKKDIDAMTDALAVQAYVVGWE